MNKLEKLILEAYSQVQEETKKAKDLPKAFVNAIKENTVKYTQMISLVMT